MAIARVVSFEGVGAERVAEMKRQIGEGERPNDLPASEIITLHDAEAETSVVILFFDNEQDYRQGDATLNATSADETPGRRTSVKKYEVAVRRTA